jgi:preprotein translocase subunit SecG
LYYFLLTIYILSCLVLIMFVLLQPGKSDAAAVFGGGANSSAFGPRGTQTVLAKITIAAAIVFFLTAFLFSIPGLFEQRSVAEGVTPAPAAAPAPPEQSTQPAAAPPESSQPQSGEQKPEEGQSKQDNK